MTPTELETLQHIGNDILRSYVAMVVHTITFTIYLIFAIKAVRVSLRMHRSKISMATLALVIVMFLIALVLWILDFINFVLETTTLINAGAAPLDSQFAVAKSRVFEHAVVIDLLYSYMCILGDSVIIWRVKVFWWRTAQRWVLFIALSCLAGSVASSVLLTYCGANLGAEIINGSFQKPLFCKGVQTASYSMGFVTTAVATILISIKTWQFRTTIKPMANNAGRVSRVEKMMTLLIESGVIYLCFFLVQVIGNIPGVEAKNASSFAFFVYSQSTSVIVGLYPTIVVVLAHSQHAVLDTAAATHLSTWHVAPGAYQRASEFWSVGRDVRMAATTTVDNVETNSSPTIEDVEFHSRDKADEKV